MNAGKTTTLLQSSHNYAERGMEPLVLKPRVDKRDETGRIRSRIGLEAEAVNFSRGDDLLQIICDRVNQGRLDCILVDEAQFLSIDQVGQLTDVVDRLNIPVLTYGLRTDFRGELFEGSQQLLALADELREIKTVCHCGRKAIMTVRLDNDGNPIHAGEQIQIGGNERYVSMCRLHFKDTHSDVER